MRIATVVVISAALALAAVGCREEPAGPRRAPTTMPEKVVKTDEQWRAELTAEQFRITREKGTERAFTGEYWNCKDPGVYRCVCCGAALFDSTTKFNSGTGWPSFHAPIDESRIARVPDGSGTAARTEVTCARCGAHLGHVFGDGPQPTGLRFCVNSASLKLEKAPE